MMRLTDMMIIFVVCFLFYLGKPSNAVRQEQEARDEYSTDPTRHEVIYEVSNAEEEAIADILWLKEAAKVAIENDSPYFNVERQEFYPDYDEEADEDLTIVEGVIRLEEDALKAEYDAFEIEDLVLPHHSEY